jgi:hypothetical protein
VDDTNNSFRITAVLALAIQKADGNPPEIGKARVKPQLDRARALTNRLWAQSDVREALSAIVEALVALENELRQIQHAAELESIGIRIQNQMVDISAAGIGLQRPTPLAIGTVVNVYLLLPVRGTQHLLVLPAVLKAIRPDDKPEYEWLDLPNDLKDLIVGFVFQQQGKERRRVLDTIN